MLSHSINALYCGVVSQCYNMQSAINKQAALTPLYLSFTGLAGDECADKTHHGGLERALHQYPAEHYVYWREIYGNTINWQAPGMGENISTFGMTEQSVCLGDQYQWGDAVIEVSQPRSPCFKLNKRWGIERFSEKMQENHRCGWLYRVVTPGIVSVNDPLILIKRVNNPMTVDEVCKIFFGDPLNQKGLEKLSQQQTLSASWQNKVAARLTNKVVESWQFRLQGE
ncbi:MOSC domain-containing protein [Colwellia sp. D2M02]|uniref:MOSC domain-containing protein n=1 Tax=Colwellia sp. D2M02 TaxID=2841562 RepID=UPI00339D3691